MTEGDNETRTKPDWKDYIAIAVALLETILLPIVVILVILIIVLAAVLLR
jgi:hypothetical protein